MFDKLTVDHLCLEKKQFEPIPHGFFRILRTDVCRQQKDKEILNKHNEGISNEAKSTKHFPKSTYNQGEDNSAYYELGDFSQESQYDKLSSHD